MERANGVGIFSGFDRIIWFGVMSFILVSVTGCNERLKRMESNQVVLEEKVDQNARQTLLLARKLNMSQATLEGRIERVQEGNNVSLAEARATRYEQEKLREETREFNQKWAAGIDRVEDHQRVLQASVNGVAGTTTVIDEGVQKLDVGQGTMQQALAVNLTETQTGFAQVQQSQSDWRNAATEAFVNLDRAQTGIMTMTSQGVAATRGVADQVAGVQASQEGQTELMQEHYTVLLSKVDDVSGNQEKLQRLTNQQTQRLSKQVATVQTDLQRANSEQNALLSSRADSIDASLSTTVQNQKGLSEQIKGHHEFAVDMGGHITAIEVEQKRINDAMQQGNRTVGSAVQAVGQDQKKLHETMKNVETTAVATQKQAESIASEQAEFHAIEDQRHDIVIQAMAGLESNQQTTQDTVVKIQKTTQGIARETNAVRGQQSQLDQGLQQESAHIRRGLTQLEKNQGQLQKSVNRVQATTNTIKHTTQEAARQTRSIRDQQAPLQQGIAQEGAQVRQALTHLEENQDQIFSSVNNVQVISNTVASNTTTLMGQQATLQRVTHENQAQLVESLDQMGANQKAMSQKADTLKQGQDEIKNLVTQSRDAVEGSLNTVSSQQNALKGSVDGVALTTGTIAEETKALRQGQLSLSDMVQSGDSDLSQKVSEVNAFQTAMNQAIQVGKGDLDQQFKAMSQTQAGLDDHLTDQRNMSQGMTTQIKTLQQDQTKIIQAIEEKQQAWDKQTDYLTQRVATLEQSLGQVDQNVSSLQTNLVSQITQLTQVIKALQDQNGSQRTQLVADMKDLGMTLKQIQTAQSSLATRVEQVDANQKQQSKEFLTALEKGEKKTEKTGPIQPAESEPKEVDVVK